MLEHVTRAMYYFQVHLLYASIVGVAAWFATSLPRGSATIKYWIWVATSLNFILPIGALVDRALASHLYWAAPLGMFGDAANRISRGSVGAIWGILWILGSTVLAARLYLRLKAEYREGHLTNREDTLRRKCDFFSHGIQVRFDAGRHSPAVDGVLRPFISLPDGIDRFLTRDELKAVLIHELAHARRRDNLIRLVHEITVCLLWFHPLVWLAGSRLGLYRELSCDESVIQCARGGDLVSALAKLADPESGFLLQASASSFINHRLPRLAAGAPRPTSFATNTTLILSFGAVIFWGVLGTVAHTACCFRH